MAAKKTRKKKTKKVSRVAPKPKSDKGERVEAKPSSKRGAGGFQPQSSAEMPRFGGIPTFLRLPIHDPRASSVDVVLVGCPYDGGTCYRPGARFGPRAVREASALGKRFSAALGIDIYDELRIADGGDILMSPHDMSHALSAVSSRAEQLARGGIIGGFVGGDQTITLGALRGVARAKLKSAGLIHIDSHCNTSPPAWGTDIHHGSAIRVALEERLIRADRVMQIGVRGPYTTHEEPAFSLAKGFEVVDVDSVKWDLYSVISEVRKLVRHGPVYLSVDLSALDPAYAPGVSFPSAGGMSTWELQQILRSMVGAEIVGFDVVEMVPAYDHAGITALAAASVLQEILSAIADTRRSVRPAQSSKTRGGRLSP